MSKKKENRSRWRILPGLPLWIRFAIIAVAVGSGVFLQIQYFRILDGLFLIIIGSLFGLHTPLEQEVKMRSRKSAEWVQAGPDQFQSILELDKKISKWARRRSVLGGFPRFLLLALLFALTMFTIVQLDDGVVDASLALLLDLAVLMVPAVFAGGIKTWKPPKLSVVVNALEELRVALIKRFPDLSVQPFLQLVEARDDQRKSKVPIAAKLMLRFPEQPEDFYGVQVQCSLNEVGGTDYPYVYAVILAKPTFRSSLGERDKDHGRKLVFEPSANAEAKLLVIRQLTTKTSGYHTNEKQALGVVEAALDQAKQVLGR